MKLITKELEKRFAQVGDQSLEENPVVVAKFFNPAGVMTWYATEYEPEREVCFGYVTGTGFDEWGTFSIKELESITLPLGLKIERDRYFREVRFKALMQNLNQEYTKEPNKQAWEEDLEL